MALSELSDHPIFRGLTVTEKERLGRALHPIRFQSGAAVLTAEQPGDVAYLISAGTLKVSLVREDGSEAILALLGPGEIIGEISLLDRDGRSADVFALEPIEASWLDRTTFEQLRREIPALSDNLIAILARRLRLANQQILALATLDVHGRVARQLLALADAYGETGADGSMFIPIRLTQSDLAALCGATRVRVNQALAGFKKQRLLTEDARHRVTLLNRTALAEYCR